MAHPRTPTKQSDHPSKVRSDLILAIIVTNRSFLLILSLNSVNFRLTCRSRGQKCRGFLQRGEMARTWRGQRPCKKRAYTSADSLSSTIPTTRV